MIDLHCHILPGIDDGPDSWEETLEMAVASSVQGVRTIVATPHYNSQLDPTRIVGLVEQLNQRLMNQKVDLKVVAGTEAYLQPELPQLIRDGKIQKVGSSILVELPFTALPLYTDDVLFKVMLSGCGVILAHPERNIQVVKNPKLIFDWVSTGIMIQVNSGSLLGKFGPEIKATAETLLRANLVHFLGSDAHSTTRRSPNLAEAVVELRKYTSFATDISSKNGELLLEDRFMPSEEFSKPSSARRSWWKRIKITNKRNGSCNAKDFL